MYIIVEIGYSTSKHEGSVQFESRDMRREDRSERKDNNINSIKLKISPLKDRNDIDAYLE